MTPETELHLMQTIGKMETQLDDMHSRLFGNGQPGVVDLHDARLDKLEGLASSVKGAIYAISGLFTALTSWMAIHTHHGK